MKRKHSKTDTIAGKPKQVLEVAIYMRIGNESQLGELTGLEVYPYLHRKGGILIATEER
jgi:hypothetical protein